MDSFVQLALIEKAKRVFAPEPDVMLSFPLLTPLGFTAAELAALPAPATAADYAAAADFARAVNFLPRDMVANSSDRMLWDVYRDVLTRAEVAQGDGSANGTASSILYDVGPDGSRVESEAVKRYRQYRDAWFVAREDYAAHKLTGDLAEDPAVQESWRDVEEPALRAALDTALHDWETLGQRNKIEAAINAERAAALRDPGLRWSEWNSAFNPDIDLVTDAASGAQYAPTGLSPRDFAEHEGWLSFELSASEMKTLVDEAPEELKQVLDSDAGSGVQSVSFEYRSVALVRPWFRPEALTSHIWRSSDPELTLSDGAEPPTGTCPAYVTACVFVRKVAVVEEKGADKSFRDLRFTIDPGRLNLQRAVRLDVALSTRLTRLRPEMVTPLLPQAVRPMRAFTAIDRSSLLVRPIRAETLDVRLPLEVFATPASQPTPVTPPPPPPERDELSILAFICKRLPKTPDPAPELKWS